MTGDWFVAQVTVGNVVTLVGLFLSAGWHARRVVEVERTVREIRVELGSVRREMTTEVETMEARRHADMVHVAVTYQRKDVQAESLASIDRQLVDIRETLREIRMTKQH